MGAADPGRDIARGARWGHGPHRRDDPPDAPDRARTGRAVDWAWERIFDLVALAVVSLAMRAGARMAVDGLSGLLCGLGTRCEEGEGTAAVLDLLSAGGLLFGVPAAVAHHRRNPVWLLTPLVAVVLVEGAARLGAEL